MDLREWMAENKLSQKRMADMLSVSQPTVARWLGGVQFPDVTHIIKIRAVTEGKVTADSLVDQWEKTDGQ